MTRYYYGEVEGMLFSTLVGKTLSAVEVSSGKDEIKLATTDGELFIMWHDQDCCESVYVEDICGDLEDLIGNPVLYATDADNSSSDQEDYGTHTWTFYNIGTIKGSVTIRWYGSSNGFYSEAVSFAKLKK